MPDGTRIAAPRARASVRIGSGWFMVLMLAAAGCGSGTAPNPDAGPCGTCPAGDGCDVASRSCAPGSGEGARCGSDAPVATPTICQVGLECGPVSGGLNVCAHPCTTASDCPSGETCFASAVDGGTRTYCA